MYGDINHDKDSLKIEWKNKPCIYIYNIYLYSVYIVLTTCICM